MSHTELSQHWRTACKTRSLTALMRPLFHTSSWFVLHLTHTNILPSSCMDDLQICMKVQYDVLDGDLSLCTICEWQKVPVVRINHFNLPFMGFSCIIFLLIILGRSCHSHVQGARTFLIPGNWVQVQECPTYFMLEIKVDDFFSNVEWWWVWGE